MPVSIRSMLAQGYHDLSLLLDKYEGCRLKRVQRGNSLLDHLGEAVNFRRRIACRPEAVADLVFGELSEFLSHPLGIRPWNVPDRISCSRTYKPHPIHHHG